MCSMRYEISDNSIKWKLHQLRQEDRGRDRIRRCRRRRRRCLNVKIHRDLFGYSIRLQHSVAALLSLSLLSDLALATYML